MNHLRKGEGVGRGFGTIRRWPDSIVKTDRHVDGSHISCLELLQGVSSSTRIAIERETHGTRIRIFPILDTTVAGSIIAASICVLIDLEHRDFHETHGDHKLSIGFDERSEIVKSPYPVDSIVRNHYE